MTRRFIDAEPIFRKLVLSDNRRIDLAKKFIICLIQTGKYHDAFSLFYDCLSKNTKEFISETISIDDCPCREIIYDIEHYIIEVDPNWRKILLGILWKFCDLEISYKYFDESVEDNKSLSELKSITIILKQEMQKQKTRESQDGKETD